MKNLCIKRQACKDKHVDLLLIGEGKRHYVYNKDFNTSMYDHTFLVLLFTSFQ